MGNCFKPPKFCRTIVCVTDDPTIAATLSSMVGTDGEYVSVLPAPRMTRSDAATEVIRRCNSAVKVSPHAVVLAGVGKDVYNTFKTLLGSRAGVTLVDSVEDALSVAAHLEPLGLAGELRCRVQDIGVGLLQAKYQRKLLRVDEAAPALTPPVPSYSAHAVVLDDHDPLAQVIAANYAYSIGADLILIPSRDENLRDVIYQELDASRSFRGEERSTRAYACLKKLRPSIEASLQFGNRDFVTFITRGIPYGYFYHDAPSTHLLSTVSLGESLNAAIRWARSDHNASAAVLIDPGYFPLSETPAVSKILKNDGVHVFEVLDEHANVENVGLFIRACPFDLLFICSHCGEVGGERFTLQIPRSTGAIFHAVIDIVVQFGTTKFSSRPGKNVSVHELMVPVAIDGMDWFSAEPELRETVWQYLESTKRNHWDIVRRENIAHVRHSTAIRLKDSALMFNMQQVIDVRTSPVIFNNSCVSFYDAARTLMFAGARAYIGTLTPVETSAAQQLAEQFFVDSNRSVSLPLALHQIQRQVFSDPDDRTYVHVGCHFEALRPPLTPAEPIVMQRIRNAIDSWKQQLTKVEDKQRENIEEAIRFLSTLC